MSTRQPPIVSSAAEGLVDEAVVRRLIEHSGVLCGPVYVAHGKQRLRLRLDGYNQAARLGPWLVLTDLNHDADCAPPLCACWLPQPASRMCFRVAVRAVEAWLLADRECIAHFLAVAIAQVPLRPDELDDPKHTLVRLAARSRRRNVREDMVPRVGSGRSTGAAYTSRLIEFAANHWRPDVAASGSESLGRCLTRLKELIAREQ